MLGNRVNDLEARLATQGKLLAEREYENNQLRQANEAAERTAKELRDEIAALAAAANRRRSKSCETEKAAVEEQLRIARDERAKLQRDINAIQQQAESSWATERMENALLRERINDIAAEVAKLAMPAGRAELADRGHAGSRTGDARRSRRNAGQWRRGQRQRPAALPKAAARWPSASGRCSPTPPAPASSRSENSSGAAPEGRLARSSVLNLDSRQVHLNPPHRRKASRTPRAPLTAVIASAAKQSSFEPTDAQPSIVVAPLAIKRPRHCERSEAIQLRSHRCTAIHCLAPLPIKRPVIASAAKQSSFELPMHRHPSLRSTRAQASQDCRHGFAFSPHVLEF